MATPLTAMGRYAGVLMAVMCALLMFAFVIGDPLMQYGGGSGVSARDAELVASWNGGRVNERQLDQAVMHRNVLAEFQQRVFETGRQAAQEAGVDLQFAGLRVRPINLPRTREQGVEADIVRTRIFAQKARDTGMVVTNDMIKDYLRAIGFDRVSNSQMREMLSRMNTGNGRRATIDFVFDLLREAMLANNYLSSYDYAYRTILPEERWQDWRKVNERVVVEAAPVKTVDFVGEVPDPTDEELEAFYAEHRNREPSSEFLRGYGNVELPSPLPAFATPPRVKLSVLKADYDAAVDAAMDEVTDEQVAEYYKANKESFVAADKSLFGDDSLFGPSDLLSDEEIVEEDTAPAEGDESADAKEETPADEEETASEEPQAEEPVAEDGEAVEGEAAVEEEEEEEEADGEEDAAEGAAQEAEAQAEESELTYQPLEEVADEIRRRLASQLAAQQLQDKMNRLKLELQDAYDPLFEARLDAEADGDEAELPEPSEALTNLKPLAEKEQLELTELDLAPQIELRETPVGRSILRDPSSNRNVPFWYLAYRSEEVDTFEPQLAYGQDSSIYLVLVTERYEAQTPELADIRDRVVAEWKRVEAAKLALAAAEKLAEEAAPTGQSLADYLAGKEGAPVAADAVEKTDPFALFTIGQIAPTSRQIPLRLSQPQPLVAPGPELLEGVFELGAGKVGAELNHDHSIAYVLRIAERIGSENELRREFLRDGDRWLGSQSLMQARATNKLGALLKTLLDESGLEWERPADQVR